MVYGFPTETLHQAFIYLKHVNEMDEFVEAEVEAHALLECGYFRAKQMIVIWAKYGHLILNK